MIDFQKILEELSTELSSVEKIQQCWPYPTETEVMSGILEKLQKIEDNISFFQNQMDNAHSISTPLSSTTIISSNDFLLTFEDLNKRFENYILKIENY